MIPTVRCTITPGITPAEIAQNAEELRRRLKAALWGKSLTMEQVKAEVLEVFRGLERDELLSMINVEVYEGTVCLSMPLLDHVVVVES